MYKHSYKCIYFKLHEILPKKLIEELEKNNKLDTGWLYFPEKALMMLDNLRLFFKKPIKVNNWITHKNPNSIDYFQYRGLRTLDCPEYSKTSQHAIGNAFDFDVEGLTAEQARQEIIKNKDTQLLKNIGGLELGKINWIHVDARPRVNGKIVAFDIKNNVSYI